MVGPSGSSQIRDVLILCVDLGRTQLKLFLTGRILLVFFFHFLQCLNSFEVFTHFEQKLRIVDIECSVISEAVGGLSQHLESAETLVHCHGVILLVLIVFQLIEQLLLVKSLELFELDRQVRNRVLLMSAAFVTAVDLAH